MNDILSILAYMVNKPGELSAEEMIIADLLKEKLKAEQNPYWKRICKLSDKQRAKGMETYGQGLEMNPLTILERLTYLEEELIDGLMYIEHIKAWLYDTKGEAHDQD